MGEFIIRFMVSVVCISVFIFLILLIKKGFKRYLTIRYQYNMDLLILLLLAAPFFPNRWNLNQFPLCFSGVNTSETAAGTGMTADRAGTVFSSNTWMQDIGMSVSRNSPEHLILLFTGIWICGILVFACRTVLCNRELSLILESAKPCDDDMMHAFLSCKKELGIRKDIGCLVSVLVSTPMVVGIIHPRVVFPLNTLQGITEEEMKYCMLHELIHCKHKDIAMNALMCLLQIIYWFHPLVYFVFKKIRLDRETACDNSVLQHLPVEARINYGETLIRFAYHMSKKSALSLGADIGGTKRQIAKRIEEIAEFKPETTGIKVKSMGILLITILITVSQLPLLSVWADEEDGQYEFQDKNVTYEDLSHYFGEYEGSFVLYDMQTHHYTIYNREASETRVSPDSTYKIYSALIALETGVVAPDASQIAWDGTLYPYEAWNYDQDMSSAMKGSVNWYFQQLDAEVGIKDLALWYDKLNYGNEDLSGGLNTYWMESSLRISPIEQVQLLRELYSNESPFSQQNEEAVKAILLLSEHDGIQLYGKTGTGIIDGKTTRGWLVGFVVNADDTFLFATNIRGDDQAGGSKASEITLSILQDKGLY